MKAKIIITALLILFANNTSCWGRWSPETYLDGMGQQRYGINCFECSSPWENYHEVETSWADIIKIESLDDQIPKNLRIGPDLKRIILSQKNAVVNISTITEKEQKGSRGKDKNETTLRRKSLGTGIFINERGYILTNTHMIDNKYTILVKLSEGKEYTAKIIGFDSKSDLALIKIDFPELTPYLKFNDSDKLSEGEWVIAIGSPFGLKHTASAGVIKGVSAKTLARYPFLRNMIQTDTFINPGNSGGPLLNLMGEIVGINTAIITEPHLNTAIPSHTIKAFLLRHNIKPIMTKEPFNHSIESSQVRSIHDLIPVDKLSKSVCGVSVLTPSGRSSGTGFIITKDGYIFTNNHIIKNAGNVKILLSNGIKYDAIIKGIDERLDIALLKVETKDNLPIAELGDSQSLEAGEWVVAMGNSSGFKLTIETGIVSANGQVIGGGPYDKFIQTDASINPENSGGPLFNMEGKVIGINTAVKNWKNGIGFVIPISMVKSILPDLIIGKKDKPESTKEEIGKKDTVGLTVQDIKPDMAQALNIPKATGVIITDVEKGSPADKAGIQPGDIILQINKINIHTVEDYRREILKQSVENKIVFLIKRGKSAYFVAIRL